MSLQNTRYGASEIARLIKGVKSIWFIGVGGVHMASLARFCAQKGYRVGGSDSTDSRTLQALAKEGIHTCVGHRATHVQGFDAVVYTLAISPDNPEYTAAREKGLPLFSRADFLGYILSLFPHRIGVSGAHGKSTVTAMLADIFTLAGRSPTVFCGAPMRRCGGALLVGEGEDAIFEACEYQDSFLSLPPTLAVVLNVAHDHADYFPTLDAVKASFARFSGLVGAQGSVLACAEDVHALETTEGTLQRYTFGIEKGDFSTRSVAFSQGCATFTPVFDGKASAPLSLRVPGRHNLFNAMAAAGAAYLSGISPEVISAALSDFRGAGRRMEYRGRLRGAAVYDDYAHHPDELRATLLAARQMVGNGRVFALFQSHTYTRTAAFFGELCTALRMADRALIAPIYAARERDTLGMSAEVLARGVGESAVAGELPMLAVLLCDEVHEGDLVVVMGAGDIDRIFAEFSAKDFTL